MSSLTVRRIDTAKPDPTKDVRIADGDGLYLKVAKTGTKTFTFRYTYAGRGRKELTLGAYPVMGLAEARDERQRQAKILAEGKDPLQLKAEARQVKKEALTVEELIESFHTNWLKEHFDKPDEAKAILVKHIGTPLGKTLAPDVTSLQITRAIQAIVKAGHKVMANRTLTLTRKMFETYALVAQLVPASPVDPKLTRKTAGGSEKPKKRSLSWDKLKTVLKVLHGNGYRLSWQTRLALLFGVATAKRPFEIVTMEWSHVDLEKGEWLNPQHLTKEKHGDHLVFLNKFALEILREAHRVSGRGRFVWPGVHNKPEKPTHIARHTLSHAVLDLLHAGAWDFKFTPHNFRHTFSSRMADLRVPPHVVEKCLDHLMTGTMAIYNDADYFPDRLEAMDLWGTKLEELSKD